MPIIVIIVKHSNFISFLLKFTNLSIVESEKKTHMFKSDLFCEYTGVVNFWHDSIGQPNTTWIQPDLK
jgi:hypothetical protein